MLPSPLGRLGAAALVCLAVASSASAGIDDYALTRTFTLPPANNAAANTVLFDNLADGRLLALNEAQVLVETAVGSGSFASLGTLPGFAPTFGPSFLAVSPDGTRAVAGSNGGGSVTVFDTASPTSATNFAGGDFDGAWIDNGSVAVSNASGVQVLDATSGTFTTVVTNVGGASGGVALDAAGNLYTGNGFDTVAGGSETGTIKSFAPAQWRAALTGGAAADFENNGTLVADLLSAGSLGFDAEGNLFVGGGDFFGDTPDAGYAGIVAAGAVGSTFVTAASGPEVLRKFASPQATVDNFQSPIWTYNEATGEAYLRYFGDDRVSVYAVPEPSSLALLGLGGLALLVRRRRRTVAAVAAGGVALAAAGSARAAYTFDANDFAVEVVASTGLSGSGLYNDPQAVLGRPTLRFDDSLNPNVVDLHRAKLNEGVYNTGPAGEKLVTTVAAGTSITVRMGRLVENDPQNPFGVDFVVFGNSFYTGSGGGDGFVGDDTNLNNFTLDGNLFDEPTGVSVSPDGVNWYRYENGPFADSAFATNSYRWDSAAAAWTDQESDPTLPVDPALAAQLAGRTGADVLDNVYAGSAGGTGFDLAESGFDAIRFIRVDGLPGLSGGEVDAFADVRAVPEPATLAAAGLLAAAMLRRRRTA